MSPLPTAVSTSWKPLRQACDERADGCIKCAERGFSCPGYDRTVDIFFHDETAIVKIRAKKAKAKAIAARDARDGRDPRAASLQIQVQEGPKLHMIPSLIDQGIAFFMSHYSVGVDQPPIQSEAYNKHLSTDGFHPLVATTMTALGIAGVANLYMDPGLKSEATRWYLNAIKMANAAITSHEEVKADTTLIAVTLLSMFEATFNESSLSGWSNHVNGAASLVRMRGMDQFSTPAGQRMYLHTVGLLTMNCMGRGEPLPEYVREMNHEMMRHMDIKDPRNAFFFLHIKTIDLRAHVLNQQTHDMADIIQRALELDHIAVSIFKDADPDWAYDEVRCDPQLGIYGDYYHVYYSSIAAQTWNWVRYNRIYFHDIIRNCILAGFSTLPPTLAGAEYHEQLAESARILSKLQSDILASMPQFLHDVPMFVPSMANYSNCSLTPGSSMAWTNTASTSASTSPSYTPPITPSPGHSPSPSRPISSTPSNLSGFKGFHQNFQSESVPVSMALIDDNCAARDRLPIVRISGGSSIVWALYVAGSMPTASPASQDQVFNYLTRIEREFGIKQAKVLSIALKLKRSLDSRGATSFMICTQYLPPDAGPHVPYQSKVYENKVGFQGSELKMDADFQAGQPSPAQVQPVY